MTYCLEDNEGYLWIDYIGFSKYDVIRRVEAGLGVWKDLKKQGFKVVEVTVVKGRL